jgi:hypothetical protein
VDDVAWDAEEFESFEHGAGPMASRSAQATVWPMSSSALQRMSASHVFMDSVSPERTVRAPG